MTPVLGDFLRPARAHIAAAARYGADLPVPAKRGVIAELDRLVATMARYLDDLALPHDFTPASTADPEARAALDARLALRRAASSLRPAATAVQDAMADTSPPGRRSPVVRERLPGSRAGPPANPLHHRARGPADRQHPLGYRHHLPAGHRRAARRTGRLLPPAGSLDRPALPDRLPVCGPARRSIRGTARRQPVATHSRD